MFLIIFLVFLILLVLLFIFLRFLRRLFLFDAVLQLYKLHPKRGGQKLLRASIDFGKATRLRAHD